MANSGIAWIDTIFNWAVIALYEVARWLGITYEEINVWLFCVIWPVVTLALMYWCYSLWRQNRQLRRQFDAIS
ncbi:MAG: hypothetical protein HOH43_02545 [Candidatus Latescibacteria bacterium]|jgi:hypothetical protein|nr:hypothetical protein [Candidatus Latescibacterota bacterium]